MNQKVQNYIDRFFEDHEDLREIRPEIFGAIDILMEAYRNGNKVLICGNGGSASDSEHIVGELMKGFLLKRPIPEHDSRKISQCCNEEEGARISQHLQGALPAISLVSHTALTTAFSNDVDPQMVFAQQVYGYRKPGDVLIGLSTSGNSKNVYYAAVVAKASDMKVIGMTGCKDSLLSGTADVTLRSRQYETFLVQEDHLKIYHLLCGAVELELYEN